MHAHTRTRTRRALNRGNTLSTFKPTSIQIFLFSVIHGTIVAYSSGGTLQRYHKCERLNTKDYTITMGCYRDVCK